MNEKQNKSFIKKTISSLYEVENFLSQYNKFSDIVKIIKVAKSTQRHQNPPKKKLK